MNKLELRIANIKDSKLYFKWANDQTVRENALNPNKIIWEEHFKWFTNKLSSSSKLFILYKSNTPVGQIRLDYNNEYWEIDYSIDKSFRGIGLGSEIIKLSMKEFNTGDKLRAIVKKENVSSIKVFEKLKFNKRIDVKWDLFIFEIEIS